MPGLIITIMESLIKKQMPAFFTVLIMPVMMLANEGNDIQYRFTQTDSSYSFYGSFKINSDPNCLIEISYYHEHILALAPDAKEVKLLDQGSDWNQVSYTYRKYIFFENRTVWHRKLDKDKQKVDFCLLSSENNLGIMPRIISSSGYYKVINREGYLIMEYYQECELASASLTEYYLEQMKKEAINFIHRFSEYAEEHCKQ